jgi:hypothetical protein
VKNKWLLELEKGQEYVDADEFEITSSGALAFYRSAGRTESQRTLLSAFSPSSWRRCVLESGS